MKNDILLRQYREQDYATVIDKVVSEKYLKKYLNKGFVFSMLSAFGLNHSKFYVLELNNNIVGAGVIRQKRKFILAKKTFWLYGIEINEKERGNGYGTILLEQLLNILVKNDVKQAFLTVNKDNTVAANLYEKMGFKVYLEKEKSNILICNLC